MARIKKVEKLVYASLVNKPETRSDDFLLILDVLKTFVSPNVSLETVMTYHKVLGIPSIETITRTRRKLQNEYPELVDAEAKKIRKKEEEEFFQYAINLM